MNQELITQVKQAFEILFETSPAVFRSPGRVNIIGEHTDYNEGFVLPAAIDKAIYVGLSKRNDSFIKLHSLEFGASYEASLDQLERSDEGWPDYILGVVDQFKKRGLKVGGFNLLFHGDIPIGSGLSSSAAVECATAYALNEIFESGLSREEIAFVGQKAEHEFVGVMCGIMDQFASVFGKQDHLIKLDCRSLEFEYIPVKLEGYCFLLLNTNVKHSLASSEYNTRRAQCEEGVAMVKKFEPAVSSLRDVSLEMLEKFVAPEDQLIFQRCSYVVKENKRLLDAIEDIRSGDMIALGEKLFQTHEGLSKEYGVSCKELDFLVDQVRDEPAVLGARMMGGGFGGCTINLVEEGAVDQLVEKLVPLYKEKMNLDLDHYIARTGDGSNAISQ